MPELSNIALMASAFLAGGSLFGLVGVVLGKRSHSSLGRSNRPEMDFEELVEVAPAGLWRTDQSGRFIFINQALKELSGFAGPDEFNEPWIDLIHPDDRDQVVAAWSTAVARRQAFSTELRWLHPDGSIRWLVSIGRPEFSLDGQFTGYAGCNIDIGRLKEMEDDLKVARDTAENEAASKSTFLVRRSCRGSR